jgi:predicted fused transcriptional regulator/phosphomethylpyrimidine kinase
MEIENLQRAMRILEKSPEFALLIPEVRSNLVMARKGASTVEDVVGIPGRITVVKGHPHACAEPDFGASSHMARLVLSMMKHDPEKRSALNMSYHPHMVEICRKLNLRVSYYDRSHEPADVENEEGETMSWGVEDAISRIGAVPDVIYHTGGWGKEPMLILVGNDATEVARTAVCLAKLFNTTEIGL